MDRMSREERTQKKWQCIFRFKEFMNKHNRKPTPSEVDNNEIFKDYTYSWVKRNIGGIKTIASRIKKGIY